jgi:hypothetical protein
MDNAIIKKRLSTFKSSKGSLTRVSDDVLADVIRAWEQWTGKSTDLARELGVDKYQLVFLIKKAKQLKREGTFPEDGFKEIKVEGSAISGFTGGPCQGIEIAWDNGKLIRFSQVELLVDFLKKVA